jgi:hypothetical protein
MDCPPTESEVVVVVVAAAAVVSSSNRKVEYNHFVNSYYMFIAYL